MGAPAHCWHLVCPGWQETACALGICCAVLTRRLYWPVWSNNACLAQIDSLLKALHEAEIEGLQARDYHLTASGVF